MMRAAAFGTPRAFGGRVVRELRFVARSAVPVSALCLVANGLREHLRGLLGVAVEVTFGEAAPLGDALRTTLANADCFLTRGRTTDVALFVDESAARRLISAAYGERIGEREMSALERATLARLVCELATLFEPLCGERYSVPALVPRERAAQCVAYVDMRIGEPIEATLGLGLTRETAEQNVGPTIKAEALHAVECEVRAEFARGTISADRLVSLGPGMIVRMDTKVGEDGVLKVAGHVVARGRGGVVVGENEASDAAAFAVDAV